MHTCLDKMEATWEEDAPCGVKCFTRPRMIGLGIRSESCPEQCPELTTNTFC